MPSITKRELVMQITDKTGLTQAQVLSVLQTFLDDIVTHLANNHDVVLRNFGTFEIRMTGSRTGRNPKAPDQEFTIPARAVVKFKAGKDMKAEVAKVLPVLEALKANSKPAAAGALKSLG